MNIIQDSYWLHFSFKLKSYIVFSGLHAVEGIWNHNLNNKIKRISVWTSSEVNQREMRRNSQRNFCFLYRFFEQRRFQPAQIKLNDFTWFFEIHEIVDWCCFMCRVVAEKFNVYDITNYFCDHARPFCKTPHLTKCNITNHQFFQWFGNWFAASKCSLLRWRSFLWLCLQRFCCKSKSKIMNLFQRISSSFHQVLFSEYIYLSFVFKYNIYFSYSWQKSIKLRNLFLSIYLLIVI